MDEGLDGSTGGRVDGWENNQDEVHGCLGVLQGGMDGSRKLEDGRSLDYDADGCPQLLADDNDG